MSEAIRINERRPLNAGALCPCGSGLRAARCCGMENLVPSSPEATRHLVPLVERAIQAHRTGAIDTAERLCLDVLELAPDRPGARPKHSYAASSRSIPTTSGPPTN